MNFEDTFFYTKDETEYRDEYLFFSHRRLWNRHVIFSRIESDHFLGYSIDGGSIVSN